MRISLGVSMVFNLKAVKKLEKYSGDIGGRFAPKKCESHAVFLIQSAKKYGFKLSITFFLACYLQFAIYEICHVIFIIQK